MIKADFDLSYANVIFATCIVVSAGSFPIAAVFSKKLLELAIALTKRDVDYTIFQDSKSTT